MKLIAYGKAGQTIHPLFCVVVGSVTEARKVARKAKEHSGPPILFFDLHDDGRFMPLKIA